MLGHAYCIYHETSDLKVALCSGSDLVAAYREIWSYIDTQASAGRVEVDERNLRDSDQSSLIEAVGCLALLRMPLEGFRPDTEE